ncbi:hypothetical protein K461DRAFT_52496 [Myriangium duriaei CBS 260.36]|uniref:Uncharacterized protein n=1 Tax=Myriangium duriaei CBS 260.36 TaxID=1168546 RepID=A0A9P4IRL0_9PEZI|nr:hypothetical protein K461DRAFT_52496 [Myriangium duriaei CBS 260.36]
MPALALPTAAVPTATLSTPTLVATHLENGAHNAAFRTRPSAPSTVSRMVTVTLTMSTAARPAPTGSNNNQPAAAAAALIPGPGHENPGRFGGITQVIEKGYCFLANFIC